MSELNFEASRKHRICFTRVICMLREAHESDLVSYIETRLSTSASETTSECFVCGYDQSQLSPKTFSRFH